MTIQKRRFVVYDYKIKFKKKKYDILILVKEKVIQLLLYTLQINRKLRNFLRIYIKTTLNFKLKVVLFF